MNEINLFCTKCHKRYQIDTNRIRYENEEQQNEYQMYGMKHNEILNTRCNGKIELEKPLYTEFFIDLSKEPILGNNSDTSIKNGATILKNFFQEK